MKVIKEGTSERDKNGFLIIKDWQIEFEESDNMELGGAFGCLVRYIDSKAQLEKLTIWEIKL